MDTNVTTFDEFDDTIGILENIYTVGRFPAIGIVPHSGTNKYDNKSTEFCNRFMESGKQIFKESIVFQFRAIDPFTGEDTVYTKMMGVSDNIKSHYAKMLLLTKNGKVESLLGQMFSLSIRHTLLENKKASNGEIIYRTRLARINDGFFGSLYVDQKMPVVDKFSYFNGLNPGENIDIIRTMPPAALFPILLSSDFIGSPAQIMIDEMKLTMPKLCDLRTLEVVINFDVDKVSKTAVLNNSNIPGLNLYIKRIKNFSRVDYIVDCAIAAVRSKLLFIYNKDISEYFKIVKAIEIDLYSEVDPFIYYKNQNIPLYSHKYSFSTTEANNFRFSNLEIRFPFNQWKLNAI